MHPIGADEEGTRAGGKVPEKWAVRVLDVGGLWRLGSWTTVER